MGYPTMSDIDWDRAPFNEPIRSKKNYSAEAEIVDENNNTELVQIEFEDWNDADDYTLREDAQCAIYEVYPDTIINTLQVY